MVSIMWSFMDLMERCLLFERTKEVALLMLVFGHLTLVVTVAPATVSQTVSHRND